MVELNNKDHLGLWNVLTYQGSTVLIPDAQKLQSLNPKDYTNRVIVAGSRGYDNREEFHRMMCAYVKRFDTPILFISGVAPSGADDLIIRWCARFKYPCLQMPADWDLNGKAAGFIRNAEMAKIASHVLAFYDGESRGTGHMIDLAIKDKLQVKILYIKQGKKIHDEHPDQYC
ncbi:MAG: SLOG family protein [Rhodoferax sp.]|uniref:SLOG family protein n=1 Tax=Rhodoferax sp. TaxID=50421 RepID=UPI002637EB06|nr:SLOG family protein [Rhodoferax sp.]MDD2879781.1 SLOG family protein [Rhodoferax sp.]